VVGLQPSLDGRPSCWESSVVFEGMHCAACALTIEDALRAVPGVRRRARQRGQSPGRVVWSDAMVKPSDWMQAARRRLPGTARERQPLPASAAARDPPKSRVAHGLVAGLCMMQVMMYAYPAYVASRAT
jgi:Cu2+-exporting ATPase